MQGPVTLSAPSWENYIHAVAAREARIALAKQELARRSLLDFTVYFHPNYKVGWFNKELCELLDAFIEAVERQLSPCLIISAPPRHGKSELVSVKLPAYALGKHPDWEIVCATYGQDLATDFGAKVRAHITDPRFASLFPELKLDDSSRAKDNFLTTVLGGYKAVGIGGALTGRGAHIADVDDPVKDKEEADSETMRERAWNWYNTVLSTRLHPGGGKIITQTRWHEDDLTGRVEEQAALEPDGEQWTKFTYTALAEEDEYRRDLATGKILEPRTILRTKGEALHPERYSATWLERRKKSMPVRDWSALFQQNPVPATGIVFNIEWFKFYPDNELPTNLNSYLSNDLAISEKTTADFTVLWPFGIDPNKHLWFKPDMIRERGLKQADLARLFVKKAKQHGCNYVVVEGEKLWLTFKTILEIEMAKESVYFSIEAPPPRNDPVERAGPLVGMMQMGMVHFPLSLKELILREFLAFPAGKKDDTVSTASWAAWLVGKLPSAAPPREATLPDEAPAWSYDWKKARGSKTSDDFASRHKPRHINGKAR
jgi:hypothetical protein